MSTETAVASQAAPHTALDHSADEHSPTEHIADHPRGDHFSYVRANDPLAEPLLADLEREYDARYGTFFGEPASVELRRYPPEQFDAPDGAFVLLLRDGKPIAGGAFKRYDDTTAEFKRIWTHPLHRGTGLAKRIVAELEAEAARRGYSRVYLTTGPRQPEAQSLYRVTGYTPLYDTEKSAEEVGIHPFEKLLATVGPR